MCSIGPHHWITAVLALGFCRNADIYFNIILLTEQSWPLTAQLQMSALFLACLLHKTIFTYHFISEDPFMWKTSA